MKRINFNGQKMTKFDLGYVMGMWHFIPWTIMSDSLSYSEMVSHFSEYCKSKGLTFSFN